MSKHKLFEIVKREVCPTCGHERRTYRRWLHPEMVRFMTWLSRLGPGVHHTREIFPRAAKASTDAAYLTHWRLVARFGKGEYELTEQGKSFVAGILSVPPWIELREGTLLRRSPELVDKTLEGDHD
jgi:hypothetical protein